MPKKVKFESFTFRFLSEARLKSYTHATDAIKWAEFIDSLCFKYRRASAHVSWQNPEAGEHVFDFTSGTVFHARGDTARHADLQTSLGLNDDGDSVRDKNQKFFGNAVEVIAIKGGFLVEEKYISTQGSDTQEREREFHDEWSSTESPNDINVLQSNEAFTAPEMRFIVKQLGDLNGKMLLDIGCGLGEASVYFALRGARVTSSDISKGMLDFTQRLARINNVSVKSHLSAADDLAFSSNVVFDAIYAGNLLHHVDVEETIIRAKAHLAENGVFVSWDPLAYNPLINIYRKIATEVRTEHEHPLRRKDLLLFKKHFHQVNYKFFWFFTLIIFICMMFLQLRNPNKERLWKSVVDESDKWAWIYRPLAALDKFVLTICPPLKLLCWNVVVIARKSRPTNS